MPNHLSILGIFHTAISVVALIAAFYSLFADGKISPRSQSGRIYIILTFIACITSLPIMREGHPTPGHAFAIMILVILPVGIYAGRIAPKKADYLEVISMSTTLLISMIPSVVETLTRIPISHPVAANQDAPILKMCILFLLISYVIGVVYQIIKIRNDKKSISY